MANGSLSEESLATPQQTVASVGGDEDDPRPTHTRIRLRIPKNYHDEPVISRLISHYGLTVNITAALLGANARDDGWFDLDLHGTNQQIRSALLYFNELDLETWHDDTEDQSDGW
ncbi:NIL domain-containing protein [Phormidium sp. FACHB-592]|uniref:NIL domain-containing protein n=1 Tax=Stenomitos frigidus AS-A4 TaxID=2933935 RepID=A0ABV0KHW3_9CYAN|nr:MULTISPECIES: NIL domain-containing protein [Cyanophyceae]MBD2034156.1 NIL domain-containing protein [Leptolyngbya sp. FACHB-321]MBD2074010.1 NIL domain-containing protein [Phormidium sp. FACHB-592]